MLQKRKKGCSEDNSNRFQISSSLTKIKNALDDMKNYQPEPLSLVKNYSDKI